MFGCIDDISLAYNEDGIIEIPFRWSAQKNLCVYFTHILINDKYITQRYSDKVIQQHFLPDSKTTSIANMRTPFTRKVDDIEPKKPRGHEGIDKMVSDILNSLTKYLFILMIVSLPCLHHYKFKKYIMMLEQLVIPTELIEDLKELRFSYSTARRQ